MSWAWLVAAAAAVAAGGGAAALAPLALKSLVDGLPARPESSAGLIGLYVAALLFQRLCEQAQAYAYGHGEQRLTRRLAGHAYRHLLGLPMGFHLGRRSGALAQSLAEGAQGVRMILAHLTMTVGPVLAQVAVAAAVLVATFGAALGAGLLAALLAYAAVFAWGIAQLDAPAKAVTAAQVQAGGLATDGLMNVETIKSFQAEDRFVARYDGALAERERQWRRFLTLRLVNGLAVAGVFGVALTGALLLGAQGVRSGVLSLGDLVLLNAYVLQLVRPLELLGFGARDLGQGLAYLGGLLDILARPAEATSAKPPTAPPKAATLEFENVTFAYDAGRPTLRDISFRIPPGAMVAIVGPSGSGKSSLLRLIQRFHEPDGGRILLDGAPIADLDLAELRAQIALVSQDTILFNDTIAANIALGRNDAEETDLVAAAQIARLDGLLADLPDGLRTEVGERGLKLSGGEKQRIAIARAALKRARLILFDEATAALDPATEQAVWRAVTDLSRQATTLVVTHRLSTVVDADEILVISEGQLLQRGRHAELLRRGGLYADLWAAQSRLDAGAA